MEIHAMTIVALGIFGAIMGSFAGASVWRLRARQLQHDVRDGEHVSATDKRQIARLQKKPAHKDRSVCLHCGHELRWYDLLPLISWLSLRGKCRYCRKPIGWFEPAMEIGLGSFFVLSYIFWPMPLDSTLDFVRLGVWLIAATGLTILFAYDAKWYLLPDVVTFPLIGVGMLSAALYVIDASSVTVGLLSVAGSCLALSGLYYLIYIMSHHQWVGFGDVKLGLALGLLIADWRLAILALFLANFIGTLLFLPFLVTKKMNRGAHIPFGPLLIAGWAVAGLFGSAILDWYMGIVLGV